jgi:hypothetical protein
MSHVRGRIHMPNVGPGSSKGDDYVIPWMETDPRRAPLRNDVVTALQVGLSFAVFWFIFFTGYYPVRGAIGATIVMMLLTFGVSFTVTWARMASARRRRATTRGARAKLYLAIAIGIAVTVLTVLTGATAYPERTFLILLGAIAGLTAAVILLTLETYAVNVPAVETPRPSLETDEFA